MTVEPGSIKEGFVLAGGQASRMGCDKSMLIYREKTLMDRAVTVLNALDLEVRVIGESGDRVGTGSVPCIPDLLPGLGPIGGIYTALKVSKSPAIFVLACDMPLVSVALLQALAEASVESDVVVPRDSLGRLHPLCGVYSAACLPIAESLIQRGRLAVRSLLNVDGLKVVQVDTVQNGFPDRTLLNVNSPEDYSGLLDAGLENPA